MIMSLVNGCPPDRVKELKRRLSLTFKELGLTDEQFRGRLEFNISDGGVRRFDIRREYD